MDHFLHLLSSGLARGAVFAVFALALVLIWRAARVVNFAQGAMAAATTYLAFAVTTATGSYWLGLGAAVLGGAALGFAVERGVMRHVAGRSPLNSVIVALGVVMVLQAVLGIAFGNDYKPMAVPFSMEPLWVAGTPLLSPYDLYVLGAVAVLLVGFGLLFTRTSVGLRMRAAAFAPETSRLLGVPVSRMLTLGWTLSAAVGALAAVLVIPTELGLNPHATDTLFVYAFTVAIVGGLDSPVGAALGGLAVGVLLSMVTGYLGSTLAPIAVLALLVVVLIARPSGIFSARQARQA